MQLPTRRDGITPRFAILKTVTAETDRIFASSLAVSADSTPSMWSARLCALETLLLSGVPLCSYERPGRDPAVANAAES
jgi:hypothetical protein